MIEMKIHHIGYLVKKMEKAKLLFIEMGFKVEQEMIYDDYREIDICFLNKEGYRIELVSPRNADSVVYGLRKKIGNSPYHICYEVDNLEESIKVLGKLRFVVCQEPHAAKALGNRKVAFLINSQMGMIELLEKTVIKGTV